MKAWRNSECTCSGSYPVLQNCKYKFSFAWFVFYFHIIQLELYTRTVCDAKFCLSQYCHARSRNSRASENLERKSQAARIAWALRVRARIRVISANTWEKRRYFLLHFIPNPLVVFCNLRAPWWVHLHTHFSINTDLLQQIVIQLMERRR